MRTKYLIQILILCLPGIIATAQETEYTNSTMVFIPGGEFRMGKNSEKGANFSPAHKVKVNSFFMDSHEVTNGEYLQFCKETNHRLPEFWNAVIFKCGTDYVNYPVIGVSWGDAKKYAEWAGKRLPTEAEWEYAARGGLVDKNYPNGNEWTKEKAKKDSTGWKNQIEPVAKYEPNGYGLYDMSGNVWEWVSDRYSEKYYQASKDENSQGPKEGFNRVIRGGSWHSGPMCQKVYYRKDLPGNWCDFAVGFRCVKDIEIKKKDD